MTPRLWVKPSQIGDYFRSRSTHFEIPVVSSTANAMQDELKVPFMHTELGDERRHNRKIFLHLAIVGEKEGKHAVGSRLRHASVPLQHRLTFAQTMSTPRSNIIREFWNMEGHLEPRNHGGRTI